MGAEVQVASGGGRLDSSAFSILGVSVRSNKEQIVAAYDDRLFDGVEEEQLAAARSRLTLARDRLAEEIRFLSDITPARARQTIGELGSSPTAEAGSATADALPNLSRLNAYSDLLARFGSAVLDGATLAHREFDPTGAREAINQTRAASGFPPIIDSAWNKELASFRDEQSRLLFEAVRQSPDPSGTLAHVIEDSAGSLSDWYSALISKSVDLYDRWSEPKLVEIEERLDQSIARVNDAPSDRAAVEAIEQQLAEWDAINQPVQLRDQAKGLDEPKSKRIFNKVRSLAIWLANDRDQYSAAYDLSRALERTFPELPSVIPQLSDDLQTLGSLVERARSQELVRPLVDAVERAKGKLSVVAREVLRGRFSEKGSGIAGELYRQHTAARAIAAQLTPPDLPWNLTRSVALELNNEAGEPHAAEKILEFIVQDAPASIVDRIREDLAALNGLKLQKEFHEAIKVKNLKKARELASRIIEEVPEERDEYIKLRDLLTQRIVKGKRTGWFWAALGGLFLIGIINDSLEKHPNSTQPPYESGTYATPTAGSDTSATDATGVSSQDYGEETAPPAGYAGPLSLSQLRYCKFEEKRISLLEPRVPQSAYSQFNERVEDFNSRCGNARYRASDEATIDSELSQSDAKIESQVTAILGGWTAMNTYVPPLTTTTDEPSDTGDTQDSSDPTNPYDTENSGD
jgi:hypothetical protein